MSQQEIKQAGLSVTSPRLKVLGILESKEPHHLTAEEIHRALIKDDETVSLGTVYRVLTQFEKASLVVRRQFEKGPAYYELNKGDHHSHLVCVHCNKITEFSDGGLNDQFKKIAYDRGYELLHHSMVLYVTCEDCKGP